MFLLRFLIVLIPRFPSIHFMRLTSSSFVYTSYRFYYYLFNLIITIIRKLSYEICIIVDAALTDPRKDCAFTFFL